MKVVEHTYDVLVIPHLHGSNYDVVANIIV